jgi:hypothetical protein
MKLTNLLSRMVVATGFQRLDSDLPIPFDQGRPLVFMHIPKTSGSAISSGLKTALAPACVVGGSDLSLFGRNKDFESIDPSIRRTIYDSSASFPPCADLVHGHVAFSTLRDVYPYAQRLTLLREPCSRLLSHWLFWRQHTDAELAVWGTWADSVRKARQSLTDFLSDPLLAYQTDNLMLRMLLWPHPLVPVDQFIDPANDKRLLRKATAHLLKFNFVDIVEDGTFVHRLESWLNQPFDYRRENETRPIPDQFRSPLHRELTVDAVDMLGSRSRLDLYLWAKIAARYISNGDVAKLRKQTLLASVARYSTLMAC